MLILMTKSWKLWIMDEERAGFKSGQKAIIHAYLPYINAQQVKTATGPLICPLQIIAFI